MPGDSASGAPGPLAGRGLTKQFGGVTVLHDVDLELAAGRVHALLGENGAGKSTLIKILSGVLRPDSGSVEIAGAAVELHTPAAALHHGIATLFQEVSIVPGLSVAENIFLGRPSPRRFGLVDFGELNRRATELLARLGQRLDVGRDASRLSPVGMTMTAIARALSTDAEVLVLDEPTAALTDAETSQLFAVIRRLTAQGVAVLYVSHRLEEVFAIADEYTVLRNGRRVDAGSIADTTIQRVVSAMVGRDLDAFFPERGGPAPGEAVVELSGVGGLQTTAVDLTVGAGEIVGIAGLAGSGRSELLRIIAGVQRPSRGSMLLHGRAFAPSSTSAALRAGVAYVPQERRADGLVPDSIERNVNLTTLDRHARFGLTSARRARRHATEAADRLDLRRRSIDQDVLTLSGGNQQKVVLAKWLETGPKVLLLDEPTRGVDVGAKHEIYELMNRWTSEGIAIVLITSEMPELLALSDRIVVMHRGRITAEFTRDEATQEKVLDAAMGQETAR